MNNKYDEEKKKLGNIASSQQMSAANPSCSVWVEASAGTGKTKVLSDRVLRLLLAKVNPQKILCLTYTKAAAVEMSERIAKRLSLWAVASDENLVKELTKLLGEDYSPELVDFSRTLFASLLDTPGGMKIQTIHGFCQDILKRFPLEAGVSPYFEVMDTRSSKEILQNIQIDLLGQASLDNTSQLAKAILHLTRTVSEFQFPEIMNIITDNRTKIETILLKFDNNISNLVQALETKLGVSSCISDDDIKQSFMEHISSDDFDNAIEALLSGGKTDKENAETMKNIKQHNFSYSFFDDYCSIFLKKDGEIRSSFVSKGVATNYPEVFKFLSYEADRLVKTKDKLASLHVLLSTISLISVAKYIIDCYNQYKKVYSTLDYEDLIVITKNLLENKSVTDWVLFKLDGGIDHILIDEAQDTSPNQWAIVKALTQEFFAGIGANMQELDRTIFVVGDRKQSIYSFQGADPKAFDNMYQYFEKNAQNFKKIKLDVSFRSSKAIMDCVNILFEDVSAKKGVIPAEEHMNHCPYRLGEGGKVELFSITKLENKTKGDEYNWHLPLQRESKITPSAQLAKQIAYNIKKMVTSKEMLVSENRPVRYGDFMFLVQQRKSFVEEFVRACKEIGVNVSGVDKLKLLEQIAVCDLISLGKFLLLPYDDLSLAEILKSPLFALNDDDLFELCYHRKNSLFSSILNNIKYKHVAETLKELLNLSGFMRPFELFSYVLVNLHKREAFIARMGIEVEDVLDEFINLTLQFEQKHIPTLENFIFWIEQDEVIVQKEMEQGESDTVKIMTAHGSKGLQAPIVILADTTRVKTKSKKSGLLWDEDLLYFPLSSKDYDTNCIKANDVTWNAGLDEYRRLLYVALTRAEDRLYIAGFSNMDTVNPLSWYSLLSQNIPSNTEITDKEKIAVYNIEQENIFEECEQDNLAIEDCTDFSHLLEIAPIESPLARPYAPSKDNTDEEDIVTSPLVDNGFFYKRGTAIHKLLQYINDVDISRRESVIMQFLEKNLPEYSLIEHKKICDEILGLYRTYPEIFAPSTLCEVPIIGELDGKIISAKVDKLVITDDRVIIVDYKTNRPATKNIDEVPMAYISQLRDYRRLLEKIYPDKLTETYLLWTNICYMMKIV